MSISTYSDLKTAVADFLNRDDLDAMTPTFIALAEAEINRRLRHWRMEKVDTQTVSSRYAVMPSDWIETVRMTVDTADGPSPLRPISHHDMQESRQMSSNISGTPFAYALVDGSFELFPSPDSSYTLETLYYASIAALSDSNTTNWVLTHHPAAYLYGALKHTAPYLQEDQRLAVWASLFENEIVEMNETSRVSRFSGTGLRLKMRTR